MAKNKINEIPQLKKGSLVQTITNNLNKHGEIRGSSKTETKNLRAMCPHHKINKKGKIKPTISNDGNGTCTCTMCGAKFSTHLYSKEESDKIVGKFRGMLDQSRFMTQAADLGKDTQSYLARLSVDTSHFGKTYGKIKKAIEKNESVKKKKNRNKGFGGGSENYGGWR